MSCLLEIESHNYQKVASDAVPCSAAGRFVSLRVVDFPNGYLSKESNRVVVARIVEI